MKQNINYFKLISGEHIVAMVDTIDREYAVIYKPLQLFVYNTYQGASVKIAKWIPFTDESVFSIDMRHIMLYSNASKDVEDYYLACLDAIDEKTIKSNNLHHYEKKEDDEDEITQAFYEKFANTSVVVH